MLSDHTVVLPVRLQAREYAARALGIELDSVDVRSPADFSAAFDALRDGAVEAVDIPGTSMMVTFRDQLGALATASKLPAVCGLPAMAEPWSTLRSLQHFRSSMILQ